MLKADTILSNNIMPNAELPNAELPNTELPNAELPNATLPKALELPTTSKISQYQLLESYIHSITQTSNQPCKKIDLIFSGGSFNFIYGYGIGLYLKKLEEYGRIKVKRVSGCSIGSLLSLWYLVGKMNEVSHTYIEKELIKLIQSFKKNKNLNVYKKVVNDYVYKVFQTDHDVKRLNKRLYITFYDTKKYKKIVVSKYKSRDHVIDCIIQSSYIPYIIGKEKKYKERYIDGIVPYIFSNANANARDILYVNLCCREYIFDAFNVKHLEKNIYKKILVGVNDVNNFFNDEKPSKFCFYNKDMTYSSIIERKIHEGIFVVLLFMMDIFSSLHLNIQIIFSEYDFFNLFCDICYDVIDLSIDLLLNDII
jgi:hypothetical protein